jgi:DNA polymerase-3 subunit epsilon
VASPLALLAQRIGTDLAGGTVKDAETMAAELEAHPNYRVSRRLDLTHLGEALAGGRIAHAVVLDTETTGMEPERDRMIELGLVKFEYDRESGARAVVQGVGDGVTVREQGCAQGARVPLGGR